MVVLVVGATGRTGREVVRCATEAGHTVRAFARSAGSMVWPEGVHAIPGDVLDQATVDRAMEGADAVVVAISMVRASNSPWARILTPLDLHSRAAACLIESAERHGVRRYVTLSAHGVADSRARAGHLFMALVRCSNIGVAYAELAHAEARVRESGLAWTIVRPTRLTEEQATGRWMAAPDLVTTSRSSIPRADVAAFLVQEVEHGAHTHESVTVTGAAA